MKKITFFALAVIALASCSKDNTCTCTTTTDIAGSKPSTSTVVYTDSKKGDARGACLSSTMSDTYTSYDPITYAPIEVAYTATTACDLK